MGIMRFNYRSETLGRYVDVTVAYPTDSYCCPPSKGLEKVKNPMLRAAEKARYQPGMKFQTIYLIHGGGDDDTLTYRYTNVEEYAQRNHVMLVTPNITNSFGMDTQYGVLYMTFLTEELPVVIQTLFASSPKREDNFIIGYAMGGNVALGAAVNHPERYCFCVDLSGGIGMNMDPEVLKKELMSDHFRNNFRLYNTTFGEPDQIDGSMADLAYQVKKHREAGDPEVKYVVVCGSEEFIRQRVENDVRVMKELNMDVEYICAPGYDHNFRLWDHCLQVALDEKLPLKRQAIYPEN